MSEVWSRYMVGLPAGLVPAVPVPEPYGQRHVGAMLAGARGYALKNLDGDRLVGVIRVVARGESVLDPSLGASVARGMQRLATGERLSHPGSAILCGRSCA